MVGKAQKSYGVKCESNSVLGLEKVDRWNPIRTSAIQSRSCPIRFLGFSNHEKGAPEARNLEVINGLQHVFEKWVERCKKCIACQGWYFEKETVTAPSDSEQEGESTNFANDPRIKIDMSGLPGCLPQTCHQSSKS
jgi:hypothetical protein